MVSYANDDGAAVMRPLALEPCSADVRKVGGVERHEDAPLGGGKLKQFLVRTTVERAFLVDSDDVVAALSQCGADPAAGYVGIEQQPHCDAQSMSTAMTSAWGKSARRSAIGRRFIAMKSSTSCGNRS
jgi:hypothetical protein